MVVSIFLNSPQHLVGARWQQSSNLQRNGGEVARIVSWNQKQAFTLKPGRTEVHTTMEKIPATSVAIPAIIKTALHDKVATSRSVTKFTPCWRRISYRLISTSHPKITRRHLGFTTGAASALMRACRVESRER